MFSDNSLQRSISIVVFAENFDINQVNAQLVSELEAEVNRIRDACHIHASGANLFLFNYGVFVGWGIDEDGCKAFCELLKPIADETLAGPITEQFSFRVEADSHFSVMHDILIIPDQQPLTLLGLSHAFAQSAKLAYFEGRAQQMIQENAYISRELAAKGNVSLTRRALAQLRGMLFDTASDITLHYNLLDTPEFFWDYPELEDNYQKLSRYLDLKPRIDILNKKLETIQNLLDMLAAEQHHKHSSFLEWIIIVLIAVDIVMYLIH